jgi:methionyl-tRNA formyltransferase
VQQLAQVSGIPVMTPGTFKGGKNLDELRRWSPDLVVVVAYGLLLPPELLAIPRFGCINVHPSLLPRWRGCAPIEWALMSGDEATGISLMKIDEGLDSGEIISCFRVPLERNMDVLDLRQILTIKGIRLLEAALDVLHMDGYLVSYPQKSTGVTFAPKITTLDNQIDWSRDSVITIHHKIMALRESGGVHLCHNDCHFKLLRSDYLVTARTDDESGYIADKNFSLRCSDGLLYPLLLQREGKKLLGISDFCNGYHFSVMDKIH